MRLIFLHTVYLLLFGVGVRSEGSFKLTEEVRARNPALGQITQARTISEDQITEARKIVEDSLKRLSQGQRPSQTGQYKIDLFKKAMDSKLDAMSNSIGENGELTNGGDSGKIKSLGDTAINTATLIRDAIRGDFSGPEGGRKVAAAVIDLTQTFANIGGAFAPPPFGQAISTGFGILNTFMSLAGLTPNVPSQTDIMKQLLNEQTKEIKNMIDGVLDEFWKKILYDSDKVIGVLEGPLADLNDELNKPAEKVYCSVIARIGRLMTNADTELHGHLAMLRTKLKEHCTRMKTSTDENKCLILLEIYSEIYKTYTDMNEVAMDVFNKKENHENITQACDVDTKISLESNRNPCPNHDHEGLVCNFHDQIKQETDNIRNDVLNPILKQIIAGKQLPFKTSTKCLKTRILTSEKFNFTLHALKAARIELKLTPSEETSKNIVCPSSKTKLMLVGGWNKDIKILSPEKNCEGEIQRLPGSASGYYRPGAAFYTDTKDGEERVMVCGGQSSGGSHHQAEWWSKRCHSINNQTGSSWRREADLEKDVMKPSLAFDSFNMHSFGGYTIEEWKKYNLYIDFDIGQWAKPMIRKPKRGGMTKAFEQIWKMDSTKEKYTWKSTSPSHHNHDTSGSPISYNEKYRSEIGARCTVFHDGQFYSQGIKWVKGEIAGRAQYTKKKSYNSTGEIRTLYTPPIRGCLWGLDEENDYVSSIKDCEKKCDAKSWCLSFDYIQDYKRCYLSKYTKDSSPTYYYRECWNTWNPNYYLSSKYSQKVLVPDKTVSTSGTWNDLPDYEYSLIHSCTVGVIFGQTSFVTSGPKGVYYFPIPYNPETNPQAEWNLLGKPPRECVAGLGWADGKLLCVPKSKNWSKNFYYFEEHEGTDGGWIPKSISSRQNNDYTFGLDAYVTVSGAFDNKCEK